MKILLSIPFFVIALLIALIISPILFGLIIAIGSIFIGMAVISHVGRGDRRPLSEIARENRKKMGY